MQSATHPLRHVLQALVRVFDDSGALIETHQSDGAFREPS
jgi:hypothetical protein